MEMDASPPYSLVRYFKEHSLPQKGWRYLFRPSRAYRYAVLHDNETQEIVDSNGLSDFLGLGANDSRVDLYFCRNRARAVLESGDTESWIEYPTGRAVKNPRKGQAQIAGDFSVGQQHFVPYLLTLKTADFQKFLADSQRAGQTVRTVRGDKMRNKSALFDEFSAAFQFPLHFGENWDAFYDCISDLQWLEPRADYIIAITQPQELLADAPVDELTVFLEILKDTHARFTAPLELDGLRSEPVPFHVVVISEDTENQRLDQWESILKSSFHRLAG